MSLDLSITGHRTSLPQRKNRSAYRFKAAESYVDESLFSNTPGRVDTALQWSPATPSQVPRVWNPEETKNIKSNSSCKSNRSSTGSPRKNIQYRVKSRSPSYCDESLFGKKLEECGWEAPWVKKEDTVRLRPLLWCPTPVLRPQTAKPANSKLAVRAVHPSDTENILGTYKGHGDFWKLPDNDSDSSGVSPSVARPPISAKPHWSTSRKDSARSSSWSGRVTVRNVSGTLNERPPWK